MAVRGALIKCEEFLSARNRVGLTQDGLAKAARVDAKTIRRAERGERVDLATLNRLAQTLGVDLAQLIVSEPFTAAMQDVLREAFRQWSQAWNARNIEVVLDLYHENAVLHLPGGPTIPFGGNHLGKAEIGRVTEMVWATVPQEQHPIEEVTILVSDEIVTVKGETKIHLPNGDLFHLPSIMTFHYSDELIIDQDVHYDTLDFVSRVPLPE